MKTIIIIDDHPAYRTGLKAIIESAVEYQVVAEAGTAADGLQLAERHNPDIVIVDLKLPDSSGISVIRHLSVESNSRLMVVSAQSEASYVIRSLQAGALGYVVKESDSQTIIDCLDAVSRGKQYIDSAVNFSEAVTEEDNLCDKYLLLTDREQDVMRLIIRGLSTRKMAKELKISENTIKTHRSNVYLKLNLKDKFSLLQYAVRIGLLDGD